MSPPDAKRALARLARDELPVSGSDDVKTVRRAERSLESPARAATFVESNGLSRLRTTIRHARCGDERDLVRRGQRVLAAFERVRRALGSDERMPDRNAGDSAPLREIPLTVDNQEASI